MNSFIELTRQRRLNIFTQAGVRMGLPSYAVEKDWWVTQILRILFSLDCANAFVFKGGTSLSKGYNLINRFSEDIDLAIDREFFGKTGKLTNNQIKSLRKASAKFISTTLLNDISKSIKKLKLPILHIEVEPFNASDADPIRIVITYEPITKQSTYLPPRILLEFSCRSLREPCEDIPIRAIIDGVFESEPFNTPTFLVNTVEPQRTFLEKVFLLHEEWQKNEIRVRRLSRHLYDLERLMDTKHAEEALKQKDLFFHIVEHRKQFNSIKGVDYSKHLPQLIKIIPPDGLLNEYKSDYKEMQESMFAGESLEWEGLIGRLLTLQKTINDLKW